MNNVEAKKLILNEHCVQVSPGPQVNKIGLKLTDAILYGFFCVSVPRYDYYTVSSLEIKMYRGV
jgi:hypothetical protein